MLEKLIGHVPFTIIRSGDVLISGKDETECIANISAVLQLLSENGIRANKKKCKFMVDEVLFLGYVISKNGVSPDGTKIESILQMPKPVDKTQLKSFLGMVNYYHRHLKKMSIILEPLHELLRKGVKWYWDTKKQKAFYNIKNMLYSEPLLVHYNPNKPIRITSDASPYGIGAVLSHVMEDGNEQPIAFTSRSLSKSERNFSQIERDTCNRIRCS